MHVGEPSTQPQHLWAPAPGDPLRLAYFIPHYVAKMPIHVVVRSCSLFLAFVHFSTLGLTLEDYVSIYYFVRRHLGCFRCLLFEGAAP